MKGTRSLEELPKGNHGKVISSPQDYMQLKLNIGSYCALLWSIFGEQCNYYRELLKLYRILDQEECFTIRDAYTREICAQITWAIINDRCSFFGQNPVASDFMPGARVNFSVSLLESITDAVRNALLIQCATFPREWIMPTPTPTGQDGGGFPIPRQPRPPPTNSLAKYNPANAPAPAPAPAPASEGLPRKPVGKNIRNPKIKAVMDPYLQKYNNYFDLSALLTASGRRMGDLPTLPQYCSPTGATLICWNSILGKCFRGKQCKFFRGHLRKGKAMDKFADNVIDTIGKGVTHYLDVPPSIGYLVTNANLPRI
jgi:hypothetical protein